VIIEARFVLQQTRDASAALCACGWRNSPVPSPVLVRRIARKLDVANKHRVCKRVLGATLPIIRVAQREGAALDTYTGTRVAALSHF
jgi:hypothetical protein